MDKARCQIREEDHEELDALVNPLKQQALDAIAEFILECGSETLPSKDQDMDIIIGSKTDVNQIMPADTEISGDICDSHIQSNKLYFSKSVYLNKLRLKITWINFK